MPHPTLRTVGIYLLALGAALPISAQSVPEIGYQLPVVRGLYSEVFYSSGGLDRAARLQMYWDAYGVWLSRHLEKVPGFRITVYSPIDFEERMPSGAVWGWPSLEGGRLILPAWGTPDSVDLWTEILGVLPTLDGEPLRGTRAEMASLLPADVVGQVIFTRGMLPVLGVEAAEPWIEELVALVALRLYLGETTSQGLADSIYTRPAPEVCFRADLSPAEALSWQSALWPAAKDMALEGGKRALSRLRRWSRKGELDLAKLREEFESLGDFEPPACH